MHGKFHVSSYLMKSANLGQDLAYFIDSVYVGLLLEIQHKKALSKCMGNSCLCTVGFFYFKGILGCFFFVIIIILPEKQLFLQIYLSSPTPI